MFIRGYHLPANMLLMEKILAAFVFWSAGIGIFFFILNRWILFTRDFRAKSAGVLIVFILLTLGSGLQGWHAGFSPLFWVALVVLLLLLAGEIRQLWLRRSMAGAPPVWQENVAEPLLQPFTTTTLAIRHYEIRTPHWHGPRLRVAHVTDLHINGMLPDFHYRLVMERVQQATPDLILFTGDFLSDEGDYADHLPALLGDVRGKLGTFAILGNHDYWSDPAKVTTVLKAAGIQTLANGVQTVDFSAVGGASSPASGTTGATHNHSITLWGCEDPWGPTRWSPPNVAPASGRCTSAVAQAGSLCHDTGLVLALSHTGDNIYRLARAGAHVVFSGHNHAGQWRLPWIGPLMVPSRFGRRFAHGHFVVRGTHLFVSAGVGITRIPFRIYCRPDIFIVDILSAEN